MNPVVRVSIMTIPDGHIEELISGLLTVPTADWFERAEMSFIQRPA